ncbi:hypothetical protein FB567DRAFT_534158 [Paraphoma chrysanthemicola]|uniref:Secreted protein n=1 Tax=Paraphoma chrysanthemicola TaxID=798071 RepID=A0A8K0R139_9PLEO|nr:hypothetical protein FB567DRAFT_534158 [Paraphoma chrysanthemicola]
MLLIRSLLMISSTTSWHILALHLCTDSGADCLSEKARMRNASTGDLVWSLAVPPGFYGQLLFANSSVRCASAWCEMAVVLDMDAPDGVAHY